jgi:hypothetical protein
MVLTSEWYGVYHALRCRPFGTSSGSGRRSTHAKTTVGAIKQWRNRNRIPGEYWLALEVGAAQRNIPGVTMHTLGAIANRRRPAEAAA